MSKQFYRFRLSSFLTKSKERELYCDGATMLNPDSLLKALKYGKKTMFALFLTFKTSDDQMGQFSLFISPT